MTPKGIIVQNICDYTYIVYTVSLIVSLVFLTISIFRIHSLLKNHKGIKLNEKHMVLHAVFLLFNIALCITATACFFFQWDDKKMTKYISMAQFCSEPLSLILMLFVVIKMSPAQNRGPKVALHTDTQGRYYFIDPSVHTQ